VHLPFALRASLRLFKIAPGDFVCPSCGARRMVELAAHLVDHVFPEVPIRQRRLRRHGGLRAAPSRVLEVEQRRSSCRDDPPLIAQILAHVRRRELLPASG
jgi:hypothetical protein